MIATAPNVPSAPLTETDMHALREIADELTTVAEAFRQLAERGVTPETIAAVRPHLDRNGWYNPDALYLMPMLTRAGNRAL